MDRAGRLCRVTSWRIDHADDLARIANDPGVVRYLAPNFPHPYERADALAWIARQRETLAPTHFTVEAGGRLVGSIGYVVGHGERAGTAVVGYFFDRATWGRGIATDALRIVTARIFEDETIARVTAWVMSPNVASARVLEKAGYAREATLRSAIVDRDGERHDELIFALVRDDEPPRD